MRKCVILLPLLLLLTGCAREETLETVADEYIQPVAMAQPRRISVELPDDVVSPVLNNTSEQMYLCNGYEIVIETREAGNLNDTIESLSGYGKEDLTVMATQDGDAARYEFVWAAAGEDGDRIGRAVILDDGNYHYCMSILRDASTTEGSQIVWRNVFDSFQLA